MSYRDLNATLALTPDIKLVASFCSLNSRFILETLNSLLSHGVSLIRTGINGYGTKKRTRTSDL